MGRGWLVALLLVPLVVPAASTSPAAPSPPPSDALKAAAAFLLTQQDERGCIGGAWTTPWAVVALAAAGLDPGEGSPSLVDGLAACQPEDRIGGPYPSDLARHLLGVSAAGLDPRAFAGRDWLAELTESYTGTQFFHPARPHDVNDDVFAILALRSAGLSPSYPAIAGAARFVQAAQNSDGGWGLTVSAPSEPDLTAAVLEALTSANALDGETREAALGYLAEHTHASGCFAHPQLGANTDTTAWVVLGLLAAHEDPRRIPWGVGPGPWGCLAAAQRPDGSFGGNVYTTTQAMLASALLPHGRAGPELARPEAGLRVEPAPVAGRESRLLASGVPFAGWQLPDGSVVTGDDARWWPTRAGPVQLDVLALSEAGVGALETLDVVVASATPAAGGSSSSSAEPELKPPTLTLGPVPDPERNVTFPLAVEAAPGDAPVTAYRVDWGDGAHAAWSPVASFEHAYRRLGEHRIEVVARDAYGATSAPATATVVVRDAAPRLALDGPRFLWRGEPGAFTATASDPDGPVPSVVWQGAGAAVEGPSATLRFPDPGPTLVEATTTDGRGNTASARWQLEVGNRPPRLVAVGPLTVPANRTVVLTAEASDPEEDPVTLAWHDGSHVAWGGQYHLRTDEPGLRTLLVNATDRWGAWTLTQVQVVVGEDTDAPGGFAPVATSRPSVLPDERAPVASPVPPRVLLPERVGGAEGVATLLEGEVNGTAVVVAVHLGEEVPVRGSGPFTALLPALPPGTYPLAARALGPSGTWGPWTNATLTVAPAEPPASEPLAELAVVHEPTEPKDAPLVPTVGLLALLAAAARGRRP